MYQELLPSYCHSTKSTGSLLSLGSYAIMLLVIEVTGAVLKARFIYLSVWPFCLLQSDTDTLEGNSSQPSQKTLVSIPQDTHYPGLAGRDGTAQESSVGPSWKVNRRARAISTQSACETIEKETVWATSSKPESPSIKLINWETTKGPRTLLLVKLC